MAKKEVIQGVSLETALKNANKCKKITDVQDGGGRALKKIGNNKGFYFMCDKTKHTVSKNGDDAVFLEAPSISKAGKLGIMQGK